MYLAMNRFKIVLGREDDFETVWKSRETHLEGVKGFKKFNLIKGATNKEFSLYVSHSQWDSEDDFWNTLGIDKNVYYKLKDKYDENKRFPTIYEKVSRRKHT